MGVAARRFKPRNPYGVIAFGIRQQRSTGLKDGALGLTVYVVRKLRKPARPIPSLSVRVRGRLRPLDIDVIGTGAPARAGRGTDAPFSGLHAGAVIRAGTSSPQLGSIACLLSSGDRPTHILTAGHLFSGAGSDGDPVFAAVEDGDELVEVGTLVANLLDLRDRRAAGLAAPADVALIALNDDGVAMAEATRGPFNVSGAEPLPDEEGTAAQIFRWAAGDFSAEATAARLPLVVHFESDARGFYTVSDVLSATPCITDAGDSGGALLLAQAGRPAVGICVGAFGRNSVFEPIDRALAALISAFGALQVWNNPT
jgi:hypothetical protein